MGTILVPATCADIKKEPLLRESLANGVAKSVGGVYTKVRSCDSELLPGRRRSLEDAPSAKVEFEVDVPEALVEQMEERLKDQAINGVMSKLIINECADNGVLTLALKDFNIAINDITINEQRSTTIEQTYLTKTTDPPTQSPTSIPTKEITPAPTPSPTAAPTPSPTAVPSPAPTPVPTTTPTPAPTPAPTYAPTSTGELTDGEVAGIIIAAIGFVGGLALGCYFLQHKRPGSLEEQIRAVHQKHAPSNAGQISMSHMEEALQAIAGEEADKAAEAATDVHDDAGLGV